MESITERLRRCNPSLTTCAEAAEVIEQAYGILWRDTASKSPQVRKARQVLLSAIDKDGQSRGISHAKALFGPVSDAEALRNFP